MVYYKQLIDVLQKNNQDINLLKELRENEFGAINCVCGGKNTLNYYSVVTNLWFSCSECKVFGNEYSLLKSLDLVKKHQLFEYSLIEQDFKQKKYNTILNSIKNYKIENFNQIFSLLPEIYRKILETTIINLNCFDKFINQDYLYVYKGRIGELNIKQDSDIILIPHYFCENYISHLSIYISESGGLGGRCVTRVIDKNLIGISNYGNAGKSMIISSSPLFSSIYNTIFSNLKSDFSFHSIPKDIDLKIVSLPYILTRPSGDVYWMMFSWKDKEILDSANNLDQNIFLSKRFSTIEEIYNGVLNSKKLWEYIELFKYFVDERKFINWWKRLPLNNISKRYYEEKYKIKYRNKSLVKIFSHITGEDVVIDRLSSKIYNSKGRLRINCIIEVEEIINYPNNESDLVLLVTLNTNSKFKLMIPYSLSDGSKLKILKNIANTRYGKELFVSDTIRRNLTQFILSISNPRIINLDDLKSYDENYFLILPGAVFRFNNEEDLELVKTLNSKNETNKISIFSWSKKEDISISEESEIRNNYLIFNDLMFKKYKSTLSLSDFEYASNIYKSLNNIEKIIFIKYLILIFKQLIYRTKIFKAKSYNQNVLKSLYFGVGFKEGAISNSFSIDKTKFVPLPIIIYDENLDPSLAGFAYKRNVLYYSKLSTNNEDNYKFDNKFLITNEIDKVLNVVIFYIFSFNKTEAKLRLKKILKYLGGKLDIFDLNLFFL